MGENVIKTNKPENPFLSYNLAEKLLVKLKKIFLNKNILIQPSEVQNPETGQKTGLRTTRKIYVQMNQYDKRNLPK